MKKKPGPTDGSASRGDHGKSRSKPPAANPPTPPSESSSSAGELAPDGLRTSDPEWVRKLLEHYKAGRPFNVIDDAGCGLKAEDLRSGVALLALAVKSGALTWPQGITILTCLGMSAAGIWMIAAAIADPEPTSKLSILLAGGVLLVLTGGLGILRSLGQHWRVTVTRTGFTIA
jgi:hypothetical protein